MTEPDRPSSQPRAGPQRLAELSWTEARDWFRRDPRLLVPVGTLLQHGPHLPLATDTIIVTRLAEALSERFGVLVAPTLPFGVGSEIEQRYAGSASLRGKTLHRVLNELVENWESQGVEEIYLLTAHGFGPHLQAIGTVVSSRARIRAMDLHAVDLDAFLERPHIDEHAGEMETSLILHLEPDRVGLDRVQDAPIEEETARRMVVGEEPVPLRGSEGVVGCPSRASAEKGRRIFEHLVEFLGRRVLEDGGGHAD